MIDEKILKCKIKKGKRFNKIYIMTRSFPNDGYELFQYYNDEFVFSENDFVGFRVSEAKKFIKEKVLDYIAS